MLPHCFPFLRNVSRFLTCCCYISFVFCYSLVTFCSRIGNFLRKLLSKDLQNHFILGLVLGDFCRVNFVVSEPTSSPVWLKAVVMIDFFCMFCWRRAEFFPNEFGSYLCFFCCCKATRWRRPLQLELHGARWYILGSEGNADAGTICSTWRHFYISLVACLPHLHLNLVSAACLCVHCFFFSLDFWTGDSRFCVWLLYQNLIPTLPPMACRDRKAHCGHNSLCSYLNSRAKLNTFPNEVRLMGFDSFVGFRSNCF